MATESPLSASLVACEGFEHRTLVNGGEACWRRRGTVVELHVHPHVTFAAIELPRLPSASTEIPPSDHLGACGHELDPWETHLEHAPDCPRVLCLEDRCDCPEVCPDCCRSCGYDTAERSGS